MREIDEHSEAVHFAHDFATEVRESTMLRAVECGVGPVERDIVRERHVAHSEVVIHPERAK